MNTEELFHSQKCGICDKSFTEIIKLRVHLIKVHKLQRNFKCEHCGKIFSQKSNLDNHIDLNHRKFSQGSLDNFLDNISQICEETSSKKCTNSKKCEQCGKDFDSISNLRHHNDRFHNKFEHGKNKLNCKICNKLFKAKQYLLSHISTFHEGKKEVKCDFCDREFPRKDYLKEHVEVEHEFRNYNCEKCTKDLRSRRRLYWHIRDVHSK